MMNGLENAMIRDTSVRAACKRTEPMKKTDAKTKGGLGETLDAASDAGSAPVADTATTGGQSTEQAIVSTESNDPASPEAPRDLLLVGDRVEQTGGYRVLRQREDRLEVGELRTIQEGQPLSGDVVRLHPTPSHERVFECETLLSTEEATGAKEPLCGTRQGPRQVATATYRKNWESIFGALAKQIDEAQEDMPATSLPQDERTLN